jgi:hypothetical protein
MGLAHRCWVLLASLDKIKSKSMLICTYSNLKNQTFIFHGINDYSLNVSIYLLVITIY